MGELYVQYEYWVAAFQLVFAMLGMGATLTASDFKDVLREPRSVTIGIVLQLILVPLAAFLFIKGLGLSGGIAVGIALIAAIPGGTTSNIFTYFAKGNVPLSISVTGVTTLLCLLSTPIILGVLIGPYLPNTFSMPVAQIVSDIAFTLLLPLVLGMCFLQWYPYYATLISKWSIRLSLLGIAMIVVGSLSAGRLDAAMFGLFNIGMVILFIVAIFIGAILVSRVVGLPKADQTAVNMEVVVRNVNLGVLIKASLFPASDANTMGDMVLFAVLLYGVAQMLIAAVIIGKRRRAEE